jgi:adenylosuccinate synthase
MCETGHEYGTTTGRKRRCGWLDLVALRYASRVNGLTGLAITKLDVLNSMETIKVCTAYRYKEQVFEELPPSQAIFSQVEPIYQELPGWKSDVSGATAIGDLPQKAIDYLNFIVRNVYVPIRLVSVGPARHQTIKVPHSGSGPVD